jgi:hypothetical protein
MIEKPIKGENMKPRMLFNGDLMFPKKGNIPPTPPKGYYPDETDAWVMHKIYKDCIHRSVDVRLSQCGIKKFTYWCKKDGNTMTTFVKCNVCQNITEALPEHSEE